MSTAVLLTLGPPLVISVAVTANGRPLFASGSGDNRARVWSY